MSRNLHLNLNRLAYFAAVVDEGSFTAAADRLGITKAVVSQQVAKLEREIGATLLVRTTRRVHPTEAGRALYSRCVVILQESADAFDELAQSATKPTGLLRITATVDYGAFVVAPAIVAFHRTYPTCTATLILSDKTLDLASGLIDVAIRVGWLADSSHQSRRIGSFRQLLVCSSSFADTVSGLQSPRQIVSLPFVANMALSKPTSWTFAKEGSGKQVSIETQASVSSDATFAVHAMVMAGGGLSVLPDYLVSADIAAGRLIHVLPDWTLPSGGIHAVFPAARFRPIKVRLFTDMVTKWNEGAAELEMVVPR